MATEQWGSGKEEGTLETIAAHSYRDSVGACCRYSSGSASDEEEERKIK